MDLKGNIERRGLRVLDILGVDNRGISSKLLSWAFVSNVELYKTTATGRTGTAILRGRNSYGGIVDAKLAELFERAKRNLDKNEGMILLFLLFFDLS